MNYSVISSPRSADHDGLNLIVDSGLFRLHRLTLNFIQRQSGIAQFDKAPDVVTLELAPLQPQPHGIGIEQMTSIETRKGVRFPGISGLLGNQPDAQPQLDIGLDDIGTSRL